MSATWYFAAIAALALVLSVLLIVARGRAKPSSRDEVITMSCESSAANYLRGMLIRSDGVLYRVRMVEGCKVHVRRELDHL